MNPLEDDGGLSRRGFLVGTAGTAAAVGASATATAQEGNESEEAAQEDGNQSDGGNESDAGGSGDGGGGTETVTIVDNAFEPADLAVEPGTTVVWEWTGEANHNINPTSQPDETDWEGHIETKSSGEYEHTFDAEGTYEYVCDPHAPGMAGSVEVSEGASQAPSGPIELVPDAAWTLVIGTVAGMLSTLSLVYAFMRYGGPSGE